MSQLIELDPRGLPAHPLNARFDLGDITELADSMREVGVLQPLVVTATDDGGWRIVCGHRRAAAATAAGLVTVPAVVRDDLAADVDALTSVIVKNEHRQALTVQESAHAYAQLAAFPGMDARRVAKRTGRRVEHVQARLTLNAMPDTVAAQVAADRLTLDQAADIETFRDDDKAYQRLLTAAANGYSIQHALAEERRKRAHRQDRDRLRAELVLAGVPTPKQWPCASREAEVTHLAPGPDADPYTADAHATCPGHAAFIERGYPDGVHAVHICRDPDGHGHHRRTRNRHVTPQEAARHEAEARDRQQRREARDAAAQARLNAVRDLLTAVKPPARHAAICAAALWEADLTTGSAHRATVAHLLGLDAPDWRRDDHPDLAAAYARYVDKLPDPKTWRVHLAHTAAIAEAALTSLDRRWDARPGLATVWLDWLRDHARLPRTDVEADLYAQADHMLNPPAADPCHRCGEHHDDEPAYCNEAPEGIPDCPHCTDVECRDCDPGGPVEDIHLPADADPTADGDVA